MRKKIKLSLFAIISGFIIENSSVQAADPVLNSLIEKGKEYLSDNNRLRQQRTSRRNAYPVRGQADSQTRRYPVGQSENSRTAPMLKLLIEKGLGNTSTNKISRQQRTSRRNAYSVRGQADSQTRRYPVGQSENSRTARTSTNTGLTNNNFVGDYIRKKAMHVIASASYLESADSRAEIKDAYKLFDLDHVEDYVGKSSFILGKPGNPSDTKRLPRVVNACIGSEDPLKATQLLLPDTRLLNSSEGFDYINNPQIHKAVAPFRNYLGARSEEYYKCLNELVGEYGLNNITIYHTGHSIGGLRALLSFMDINKNYSIDNQVVVTFGATPLLNRSALNLINNKGIKAINLYNRNDKVWKLPKQEFHPNMPGEFIIFRNGQTSIPAHQWKTGYFNNLPMHMANGRLYTNKGFNQTTFANKSTDVISALFSGLNL